MATVKGKAKSKNKDGELVGRSEEAEGGKTIARQYCVHAVRCIHEGQPVAVRRRMKATEGELEGEYVLQRKRDSSRREG